MLFLIALIVAFAFAFFCGGALKKCPYVFYGAAVLLTVVMAVLPSFNTRELPAFVNNYVIGLFTRGALATALWCVVMIMGALPNGSAAIKKLMPIRGELSIFTAILTLGHNIGYGRTYFKLLFTDSDRMSSTQICAAICTIVMLVIMIPLTVLSFPAIRRKMNAKLWKRLQRTAYLFYGLIYVHVMLLTVPIARMGREGYIFSVFMYSLVFIGYAFFRIRKYLVKKQFSFRTPVTVLMAVIAAAGIAMAIWAAQPVKKSDSPVEGSTSKSFAIVTSTATTSADNAAVTSTASGLTTLTDATTTTASAETVTTSTSEDEEESEETETEAAESEEEESPEEAPEEQETPEPEENHEPEPAPEPEPQYIYNNGDFTASAFGYDGEVTITITIENDVITNISGYSNEFDTSYFDSAANQVIPAILNSQSSQVDACSGATYSSNAIMKAVEKALKSAKR
ncbi:MAG: FMN-binding protein [Alistipes sp.]|nr:FMN-binding protein [Alistipes sp.]